jgi:hypothetical protein
MMLVGKQGGKANEAEPYMDRPFADASRGMSAVAVCEKSSQGDMQGREEIVGSVEAVEEMEKSTHPVVWYHPWKGILKRHNKKKTAGGHNNKADSFGKEQEPLRILVEEGGSHKKEINGHVGDDQPGDKGDVLFPAKIQRSHITAERSDPVAGVVRYKKE